MRIVIVGGSGNISVSIVKRLLEQGHDVTCYNRSGDAPAGARTLKGDRHNLEDYEATMQREKFDADILCAGGLEETRRLITVKREIGVSEIVHDDEIMFLGDFDDALEEIEFDDLSGRIVRKADDQHLGLRPSLSNRFFETAKELFTGR